MRDAMSDSTSVVKAQTIKQAKAAFKARGGPTISEREQRQIDRQVQLEQRAWRLREQEKKRIETSRRRQESGREERGERERALLATQVRRDKFGYKSSQMHLGAFFQRGVYEKEETSALKGFSEDEFDDNDVDDEALLHALESPVNGACPARVEVQEMTASLQRSITAPSQRHRAENIPHNEQHLDGIWDDLDSSTQIARDLANDEVRAETNLATKPAIPSGSLSFNSGDFDLSAEELDEIIAHHQSLRSSESSIRQLMPPPPAPLNLKTNLLAGNSAPQPSDILRNSKAVSAPKISCDSALGMEFSMSQLESFVDDDLQLTQMAPD